MKRVVILAEGRLKEPALRKLCDEYYRRGARTLGTVEERELRDRAALEAAIPGRCTLCVLDERGEELTSREFARELAGWLERPSLPVVFAIGGPDGVGDELRARAGRLLALGRMTFAHRLVRLLLAEQLYRAASILEGAPYHRD